MTDSFADAAQRLCGVAALLLGWRPYEFWAATPSELTACLLPVGSEAEPPNPKAIEELQRRFPD